MAPSVAFVYLFRFRSQPPVFRRCGYPKNRLFLSPLIGFFLSFESIPFSVSKFPEVFDKL